MILSAIIALGVGAWRLVRAIDRTSSSTTQTFTVATPAPDPACADPQNSFQSACNENPCNPTTVYYRPDDPGCQPAAITQTSTLPAAVTTTRRKTTTSRTPSSAKPPSTGPVAPGTLRRSLGKQLVLFADVRPDSMQCPALPRRQGAAVTCRVTGEATNDGLARVRGTARVTIKDRAGQKAEVYFVFSGRDGVQISGSGYPFDPDTGRVL
ncbi:MAG TPA: hypothetical protein VG410_01355 [Solirubrobacteraceae bacterium]|nr:hypothetical protein [Solirubrobacteraceae bacterium]